MHQHEIGSAIVHPQAQLADFRGQICAPFVVMRHRRRDMGAVTDCRDTNKLLHQRRAEGAANAVDRIAHRFGRIHPADAQAGKAVNLGEGARHHHIGKFRNHRRAVFIIIGLDEFAVSSVNHQQHAFGQAFVQAAQLVLRQIRARGIVRVGEIEQPRSGRHRRQHGVHIHLDGAVGGFFRDDHRLAAIGQGSNLVEQEGVLRKNHFIAGRHISIGQQGEQHVGPIARSDDAIRVQAKDFAEGFAQQPG